MKPRYRARHVVLTLALAGLPLVACSKNGEGGRCSTANANKDCGRGLICVPDDELDDETVPPGVCCPPEGEEPSVPECIRRSNTGVTSDAGSGGSAGGGGAAGTGGTAGVAGTGGTAGGGTGGAAGTGATAGAGGTAGMPASGGAGGTGSISCAFNSDCPVDLVCGPGGVCQVECMDDRDCAAPERCEANLCVVPDAGAD